MKQTWGGGIKTFHISDGFLTFLITFATDDGLHPVHKDKEGGRASPAHAEPPQGWEGGTGQDILKAFT